MSEVNLWNWLKPYLPEGQYSRVESPDTCPGHPDLSYQVLVRKSKDPRTGWIELKCCETNKNVPFPDEEKGLHITQLIWIENCVKYKGRVWIVTQVGNEVLWIPGAAASFFNGGGIITLRRLADHVLGREKVTRNDLIIIQGLL